MQDKKILFVITGGIAAYKSLELIRLVKKSGGFVHSILTQGGQQFITPLSVASLSEAPVYTDLFSLKDEQEMGHIRLSRESDLIVIVPASADIIAKMAGGIADDLASTTLLAADKPIMIAPAMNPQMWANKAVQRNIEQLKQDGHTILAPTDGEMACGETGTGRLMEPEAILEEIKRFFFSSRPLHGLNALVTAGPTYEAIDPVRFIGNRSSGKQGYAIAQSLHDAGANVTLISGPVNLPPPAGIITIAVQSAEEMLSASEKALPADIAVCSAAVSDWRPTNTSNQKIKKQKGEAAPSLQLQENPDILHTLSAHKKRPRIVIGFAAETNNLIENAQKKIQKKKCDMILANDVAANVIFGSEDTHLHCIEANNHEDWGALSKNQAARKITEKIIKALG